MSSIKMRIFLTGLFMMVILLTKPQIFAQNANSVTLITDVLPTGEVAAAIAVKYSKTIDGSKLSTASFEVEASLGNKTGGRTITKVYTNNAPARDSKGKIGKYVIIEMDPNDSNAGTTSYDEQTALTTRLDLNYFVTQTKDVKSVTGTIYPASLKMKKNAEVTPSIANFQKKFIQDEKGNPFNYRFFAPITKKGERYPLVIFLHGAGERGQDNMLQIVMSKGALVWAEAETQEKNPCYVVAPQCPRNSYWNDNCNLVLQMLRDIKGKYAIDLNRIYLTGLSMGAYGTWKLIQDNPELFAAAMPICGCGIAADVTILKDMPIWAFHAADDPAVPVSGSFSIGGITFMGTRDMVAAIKAAGSKVIKYTEYEKGYVAPPLAPSAHCSWILAYNNQEAIDWMFAQSKTSPSIP
jgi:predicted peptidase